MKNLKLSVGRIALGGMLALGLTNRVTSNDMATVYASSIEDDLIPFLEDGKVLQLVKLEVDSHSEILFGYLYVQDNCIFLENPLKDKTYNLSETDKNHNVHIAYCEAKQVFPEEVASDFGITKEMAEETVSNIFVIEKTASNQYFQFPYDTFAGPFIDSDQLKDVKNYGIFDSPDLWFFHDTFDESQLKERKENKLELGYYENTGIIPYYSTIYQTEPSGFTEASGIISKYYMFDEMGNKVASFDTQKDLEKFLEENSCLDEYTWKAALCTNGDVDDLLDQIMNDHAISSENAAYFIDYDISTTTNSKRKRYNN